MIPGPLMSRVLADRLLCLICLKVVEGATPLCPEHKKAAEIVMIKEELEALTDNERKEIFSNWCHACGGNLPCYCESDE